MDYIFEEWEKRLSTYADSVEKDLKEIRKCKAEIQQMKLEVTAELQKGRYVRDDHRLVLSAPEIVIGNVDRNGTLFQGGSTIVVRGTNVGVQAAGSEVVSQARNIIIQSDEATDAFFAPTIPSGGSGVRIHADQKLELEASMTAESREKQLDDCAKAAEDVKKALKEKADKQKEGFKKSIEEIQKLIEEKEKLCKDLTAVRTNASDIVALDRDIQALSSSISTNIYDYSDVLCCLSWPRLTVRPRCSRS